MLSIQKQTNLCLALLNLQNALTKMETTQQFELFRNEFLDYFGEHIITADFQSPNTLVVYTNPYLQFGELLTYICDSIFDMIHFCEHVNLHLYSFGSNECINISIN
jgi:hypothetical protein